MSLTDLFFDSLYDVITWVLIALSAGTLLIFLFNHNWRGVMWAGIILSFCVVVILAIRADKHFFRSPGTPIQSETIANLMLGERPWLSVEVVPNGPILFSHGNPNLSVKFMVTNEGRSVANEVAIRAKVFIPAFDSEFFKEPIYRQKALCDDSVKNSSESSGVPIFPNKPPEEIMFSSGLNRQEMEAHRVEGIVDGVPVYGIIPVLVGCVDYSFGVGDKPFRGQTGFIYQAHIFDPARDPAHPLFIRIGEDTPADKLVLERYFFGGQYAK